jgi:hypothetical protein
VKTSDNDPICSVSNQRLARMIDMEDGKIGDWEPFELGAIFEHLWAAPVEYELDGWICDSVQSGTAPAGVHEVWPRSYGELFRHPSPPLNLLIMVKEFAKAHFEHPDSSLPREIALVLYSICIYAALVRLEKRISSLADAALLEAGEWLLVQDWVDHPTKQLVRDGISKLVAQKST